MTLPNFQAAGTLQASAGAIAGVVWPAHLTNDIGLLFVETANQPGSTPSGWTAVTASPQGRGTAGAAGATALSAYWKRAASAAEADVAIADAGDHQVAQIITVRGCIATGDPFNAETIWDGVASTTVITCPGRTSTGADNLIVFVHTWGIDFADPGVDGSAANPSGLLNTTRRAVTGTTLGVGGGFGVWTATQAVAGAFGALVANHDNAAEQVHFTGVLHSEAPPAGPAIAVLMAHYRRRRMM